MMKSEGMGRKKARALLNRSGYASGGHVKAHSDAAEDKAMLKKEVKASALKHLKDGGCADGGMAKPRADRLKRGGKAKGHKSHTTVNVVVGRSHPQPEPVPVPKPIPIPMPPGGPGAMAAPPPDMPPPGAGPGGPMPLKRGGRAKCSDGGVLKDVLIGQGLEGAKKALPLAMAVLKKGGRAKSQRNAIKGAPAGHFAKGGRTKMPVPMAAGAGGAKGRLQKIKDYG